MFCYNTNNNNNKNTVKNGHNIETDAALYGWCIDIIDTNDYTMHKCFSNAFECVLIKKVFKYEQSNHTHFWNGIKCAAAKHKKKEGGENVYDDKEREKYAIKSELSRRLNVFAHNDLTFIIAIQLNAKIKQKKRGTNAHWLIERELKKRVAREGTTKVAKKDFNTRFFERLKLTGGEKIW